MVRLACPALCPNLHQPKGWAALPPDALPIPPSRPTSWPRLPLLVVTPLPSPLPNILTRPGPWACSLWTLPEVSASDYILPFICNKPSPPPYLGAIMSFPTYFFFPFNIQCAWYLISVSTVRRCVCLRSVLLISFAHTLIKTVSLDFLMPETRSSFWLFCTTSCLIRLLLVSLLPNRLHNTLIRMLPLKSKSDHVTSLSHPTKVSTSLTVRHHS